MKVCAVHGRFQPMHLGHLNDYVLPTKQQCDHLIIGITNSDPLHTLPDDVNLARTETENNPFTYYERYKMIEATLLSSNLRHDEFSIVPFPINVPNLIEYYVPKDTIHYLTIFDEWGRKKLEELEHHHFSVKVLFEKDWSEKMISSTIVREAVYKGHDWTHLVPERIEYYIEEFDLKSRLIHLKNKSS